MAPRRLYVTTAPGLETLLEREVVSLGLRVTGRDRGGLDVEGGPAEALRINVGSRLATRVLLRLGSFDAPGRRELLLRAAKLELARWLKPGTPAALHVTSAKSKLIHTGLVEEVLREAWKLPDSKGKQGIPALHVRLFRDSCTVSFDTSGDLLHKRGWRQETSRAPLRETLAAGLLAFAGYDGSQAFVDPMCGAGTLVLEAGAIATRTPPGLDRTFPIEQAPGAEPAENKAIRDALVASIRAAPAPIDGSDLHGGALGAARRNVGRAPFASAIRLERHDATRRPATAPRGLVVTNAPYGRRLGHDDDRRSAEESWHALSIALHGNFREWTFGVLLPRDAPTLSPTPPDAVLELENGGIPVQFRLWRRP